MRIARLGSAPRARIGIAFEPHQIRFQIGRRLIAKIAILLQCLAENAMKLRRKARVELMDRLRFTIEDGVEDDRGCLAGKRNDARGHLIDHGAERKEIGTRIGELAASLFG